MKVLCPITDLSQLPKCFGDPLLEPGCIEKCLIWPAYVRFYKPPEPSPTAGFCPNAVTDNGSHTLDT